MRCSAVVANNQRHATPGTEARGHTRCGCQPLPAWAAGTLRQSQGAL